MGSRKKGERRVKIGSDHLGEAVLSPGRVQRRRREGGRPRGRLVGASGGDGLDGGTTKSSMSLSTAPDVAR